MLRKYMNHVISAFHGLLANKINRKLILGCLSMLLVLIIYLPMRAVETSATAKKLIEYGWNAPTPDFFYRNIKEMEKRPFDGVMVKLNAGKEVFNKEPYPDNAFTQDRKDLAATKRSSLTDNFIVMWSGTEKGWDWFNNDHWAAAEKNISNFAKTAKAGNFRGIAFDSEVYTYSPWKYENQPQQQQKTFAEYQQQVRKRGAQFMKAIQSSQPNPQILTFGLLSWMKDLFGSSTDPIKLKQQLAKHTYGLWPAFINGMLDGAQPGSIVIDGHEWAYYFFTAAQFDGTNKSIIKGGKTLVEPVNYRKYDKQVKLGQAIYLDFLIDLMPKNTKISPFAKTTPHFLSPTEGLQLLEHNIYHSLRTADRYAWVYNEQMDWWKNDIPNGAEAAVRRARTKIQTKKSLGFEIAPAIQSASQKCQATGSTMC
jgi:hypothetical protein